MSEIRLVKQLLKLIYHEKSLHNKNIAYVYVLFRVPKPDIKPFFLR